MAYTVGELSSLSGITVRTLHYYDEIGLLEPSGRTAAGYRLYENGDVLRLHRILCFRELGLALEEVAAAIDDEDRRGEILRRHREVLVTKRARIDAMLASLDAHLDTADTMPHPEKMQTLFDGFDPSQYDDEVQQRWGDTAAYKQSVRRTKRYTKADWERYKAEAKANEEKLLALMVAGKSVTDAAVRAAVEEHRMLIDRWFYPCSVSMHKRLGAMYVTDFRFTEHFHRIAPGYAQYLCDAIAAT